MSAAVPTGTINAFAILFCLLLLVYASRSDMRTRSVSNIPWVAMAVAGLGLSAFRAVTGEISLLMQLLISSASTFVVAYLLFRFGLFGAADAKCLIAMSMLFPGYPSLVAFSRSFPLLSSAMSQAFPFALATLANAALLSLTVPVFLGFRNLFALGFPGFWRNLNVAFTGYRLTIEQIARSKHVRLAHSYQERDGKLERSFALRGADINAALLEQLESYVKQGRLPDRLWVTPGLPFMLFITGGFLVAAVVGNLITAAFT